MDDVNPLGDSIYYYFEKKDEDTARWDRFQKIIKEGIQEFDGIRCRIIRICLGKIIKEVMYGFNHEKYINGFMNELIQHIFAYPGVINGNLKIEFFLTYRAYLYALGMSTIRNDVVEREMEETSTNEKTLKKELK